MSAIFLLSGLAALGVLALALFAIVGVFLKLAIRLILLPLLLVKWFVLSIVMLVLGPILFVVGLVVSVVFAVALAAPLLPFVAVAALVWLIVRANRPAVA